MAIILLLPIVHILRLLALRAKLFRQFVRAWDQSSMPFNSLSYFLCAIPGFYYTFFSAYTLGGEQK